jgi:hypothetical protein
MIPNNMKELVKPLLRYAPAHVCFFAEEFMRKLVCLLALIAGIVAPNMAHSQVSFYGDFSASKLTYLYNTNVLYGPTVGTFINVATLGPVKLAADLRGTFVGASGVRLDGIVVGPRIATSVKFLKLKPYAEFMVGFARYNNGLNQVASSTTNAEIQINGGVDRPVAKLFDWRVFEYSYSQYYGLSGEYNPKTFSTGVVFHLP